MTFLNVTESSCDESIAIIKIHQHDWYIQLQYTLDNKAVGTYLYSQMLCVYIHMHTYMSVRV